jgi:glycosyltransferase involved in cell wall biosynthesis
MAKVFIGLPTYNGAQHLSEAIASIRSQTLQDWTLLISDNASTDGTESICERATAADLRIRLHRQTHNVGAWNNFKFLLSQADAPYFMWFPDDYVMQPRFLEVCVAALERDAAIGTASTNVIMADDHGQAVEMQMDAYRVIQHADRGRDLVFAYLAAREISLLFYSLFRLDVLRQAVAPYAAESQFRLGMDCYIVLRALTQKGLAVDRDFLLQTRHAPRWSRYTWTFDHANLGGGFGFYFVGQSLTALPWRWRPAGVLILSTRLCINWIYKLTYVLFQHGWREVLRKTINVHRRFRPDRAARDIDERTTG